MGAKVLLISQNLKGLTHCAVREDNKSPEKDGENNGGTGQSSDKDGKKKEDKETKTIVKTTAVPVTSPKTRPERWSFF